MLQSTPASTLENLSRLASKPGVQSTLILSKTDGSIIRSTGLLAASTSLSTASQDPTLDNGATYDGDIDVGNGVGNAWRGRSGPEKQTKRAEDVANMVFRFITGAKAFAEELDAGEEVKLLRMRTKKNEIVIVPDSKFILVVIHDA